MRPPSEDIKDILEADSGLGLTFAVNLFIGQEPPEPNDCVTIFDTPGYPPLLTLTQRDDPEYYRPSVQIRVRNKNYLTGWNLIDAIKVALHGRNHETWGGTSYTLIACVGEPALLDWDESNRARFVTTFDLQRR